MIPRWFDKELLIIDPRYYVVRNDGLNIFEIKVRMDFARKMDPGHFIRMHNPTIAVFERLNDDALNDLRRRKWIAAHRHGGPEAELKEIIARNKEAKRKKIEMGHDQIAEGFMENYKYKRRHTVTMAG